MLESLCYFPKKDTSLTQICCAKQKNQKNPVCFCPKTSKFVFVDKLVIIAQLVRKLFGLISHLFMTVI